MRRKLLLVLFTALMLRLPGVPAARADEPPKAPLWGVNYYAYFWHDDEKAVLNQLPLKIVRWGGNDADSSKLDPNLAAFFVKTMHSQNIEPILQLSVFLYKPEEAADLVKQINVDQKLGLKYWSVGNEPEYFKSSHQNDITVDDYIKKWHEMVQAMLKVDPSIQIVGPDSSLRMSTLDKTDRPWQWFDPFIQANGDLLNVVAIHFYPFYEAPATRDDVLKNPDLFAKNLATLRTYLHDNLKRDLPLMITEINLNSNPGVSDDHGSSSIFAGLWLAEIYGISAQQGVAAILPWTAVRNQTASLIDSMGKPRPTFYAMQAFADFGTSLADAKSAVDGVKLYASGSDQGIIAVLVNRNGNDVTLKLGSDVSFGASSVQAGSVTLGAYSFTRLHFDATGKLVDGTTYGQKEFTDGAAPTPLKLGE